MGRERNCSLEREAETVKIFESSENYLEAILMLKEQKGSVRSIDVVHHMNFSKPSVSRAMSLLRENGYITMSPEGWIELTESGLEVAERIYERHRLISQWFVAIGVTPEVAAADACRVEHDLSEETFEKLKAYLQKQGDFSAKG